MSLLLDIYSGRGAILNGMAAADTKLFLLGDIFYDAMSRAILPVRARTAWAALRRTILAHAMRACACVYCFLHAGCGP